MLGPSKEDKAKSDSRRVVDNIMRVEHSHHVPVVTELKDLQVEANLKVNLVEVDQVNGCHAYVTTEIEVIRVVVGHAERGNTRITVQKAFNATQFLSSDLDLHFEVAIESVCDLTSYALIPSLEQKGVNEEVEAEVNPC